MRPLKTIVDLGVRECRYALTDDKPHFFCGEPTGLTAKGGAEPYCPKHKKLCHRGPGKDWQGLAEMIRLTEQTVRKAKPADDLAVAVDEQARAVAGLVG